MDFRDLYRKEDWLAIWIGFLLLISTSFFPAFPKFHIWDFELFTPYETTKLLNGILVFVIMLILFTLSIRLQSENIKRFVISFSSLFVLALLAQYLAAFTLSKSYGFGYAFWGLFIGLFISNVRC